MKPLAARRSLLIAAALVVLAAGCRRRPPPPPASRDAAHVAAGLQSTCTLDPAGAARCWGPTMPLARVPPEGTTFDSLRASGRNACGITKTGSVVCFGECGFKLCEPPRGTFDEVAVGSGGGACALAYPSRVECWGFDQRWSARAPASDELHGLTVGEGYACALDGTGHVRCWGDRDPAVPAPPREAGFVAVAAARFQACAIDSGSKLVCWGLGDDLEPPSGHYVQIAANWEQFCALDGSGVARCFGRSKGHRRNARHGRHLREIAVGQNHACGLDGSGQVECWDDVLNFGEGILPKNGRPLPPPPPQSESGDDDDDDDDDDPGGARASTPSAAPIETTLDAGHDAKPSRAHPRLPTIDPPETPLVVTIDGHVLPIADAISSTAGGDAVRIVMSTHALGCDAASRGWQRIRSGETRIQITIASLLIEPDGLGGFVRSTDERLRVTSASWPKGINTLAGGIAMLGPGSVGGRGKRSLRIAYDATFGPIGPRPLTSLDVRGAVGVRDCGVLPPAGVVREQHDVRVVLAGHELPIRGAILTEDKHGSHLRLTSGPSTCPRALYDAPWDYSVSLRRLESSTQLTFSGAKLYSQHAVVSPRISFEVLPSTVPAEVDVRVDDTGASTRLQMDVKGVVHALRCPSRDRN